MLFLFHTGTDADICPMGNYCPQGTADPQPCPKGTFNNGTGLEQETDCIHCPAGWYCAQVGMDDTSGLCQEGYVDTAIFSLKIFYVSTNFCLIRLLVGQYR